jgi:hypothetical protein
MRFSIVLVALFIAAVSAHRQACADVGPTQAELDAAGESVEWLLPNHDYAGQRFVDLKQIRRDNAAQLRPICIYIRPATCVGFSPTRLSTKACSILRPLLGRWRSMPPRARFVGVTIGGRRQKRPR